MHRLALFRLFAVTPRSTGSSTRCTSTASCADSPRPARAPVDWARDTASPRPSVDPAVLPGSARTVSACAASVKRYSFYQQPFAITFFCGCEANKCYKIIPAVSITLIQLAISGNIVFCPE